MGLWNKTVRVRLISLPLVSMTRVLPPGIRRWPPASLQCLAAHGFSFDELRADIAASEFLLGASRQFSWAELMQFLRVVGSGEPLMLAMQGDHDAVSHKLRSPWRERLHCSRRCRIARRPKVPTVRHEIEGQRTADTRFPEVESLGHMGDNRRDQDGDGRDPRASLAPFQAMGQLHQQSPSDISCRCRSAA